VSLPVIPSLTFRVSLPSSPFQGVGAPTIFVRQPLGWLQEHRRTHNLVELCVEHRGNRIGEARQRLITAS
jgi:hypothetical protein